MNKNRDNNNDHSNDDNNRKGLFNKQLQHQKNQTDF